MNHSCKTDLQELPEVRPRVCPIDASMKGLEYLKLSIILTMHIHPEHETSGVVIPSEVILEDLIL
jgi:hypothetical protein